MLRLLREVGSRFRVLSTRILDRLGLHEHSFLLLPAILIGITAACGAVAFHELIVLVRDELYLRWAASYLYGRGIWLLLLLPALGGLAVGLLARLFGGPGLGVAEVIESVVKTQGFIRPRVGLQKIITASLTIGSGGSAGAEGPIVLVGAAISSAVGQFFRISRHQMPLLVGCGAAAGISAIFNAPIGGVLFTLEVILQDFSIRAFTPLMVASVVANVVTRGIYHSTFHESYRAIFAVPPDLVSSFGTGGMLEWYHLPNFGLLGVCCGLVAAGLTGTLLKGDHLAEKSRIPKLLRPAVGGFSVGVLGIAWIAVGYFVLGVAKPFSFEAYPLPAFFSDGYGVIHELLSPGYYGSAESSLLILMLALLCGLKLFATALTLSSGGSGGIIAPALFLGATTGAALGMVLKKLSLFADISPAIYALIGMGAVLGAVVHAPLAAILILLELVSDYRVITPAMLATIFAVGMARFLVRDSHYTHALRTKGILVGSSKDASLLRRLTIEHIGLDPAMVFTDRQTMPEVLRMMGENLRDAVIVNSTGDYVGMLRRQDIETALLRPDSIPLLLAGELARAEIPVLLSTDDLHRAMEVFREHGVATLAVCVPESREKVVGVVSQQTLVARYHDHILEND